MTYSGFFLLSEYAPHQPSAPSTEPFYNIMLLKNNRGKSRHFAIYTHNLVVFLAPPE
jgi:hypothetical protein